MIPSLEPEVNRRLNRPIDAKPTPASHHLVLEGLGEIPSWCRPFCTPHHRWRFCLFRNARRCRSYSHSIDCRFTFRDEAADSDAAYLNDKIAESLINSLSKLPKLRVVPRSMVAELQWQNIDPRKMGQS